MGYFRRPIRRRRCASQVAAAVARQTRAGAPAWVEVPSNPPRAAGRTVYLRFAVGQTDDVSREQLGVFQAAYELRDACGRESDVGRMLQPLFGWFCKNLHGPNVTPAAIFWFKSDAAQCVSRIWGIVHVLEAYGAVVWMMRSEAPGEIVY
jgi:hypothetical protein